MRPHKWELQQRHIFSFSALVLLSGSLFPAANAQDFMYGQAALQTGNKPGVLWFVVFCSALFFFLLLE
jgi:hypothetical protein